MPSTTLNTLEELKEKCKKALKLLAKYSQDCGNFIGSYLGCSCVEGVSAFSQWCHEPSRVPLVERHHPGASSHRYLYTCDELRWLLLVSLESSHDPSYDLNRWCFIAASFLSMSQVPAILQSTSISFIWRFYPGRSCGGDRLSGDIYLFYFMPSCKDR